EGGAAGGPMFLQDVPATRLGGSVAGQGLPSLGNLLIGFDLLRPYWGFRDFTLAVPSAAAGSFPLVGGGGHARNHFPFVAKVIYGYQFADWDFGVSASGSFLNLTGRLQRGIASTDGSMGELTANSSLTIVSANLIEVTREIYFPDLMGKSYCPKGLEDVLVGLSLGTRYGSIDQNYSGSLTNEAVAGANVTTR